MSSSAWTVPSSSPGDRADGAGARPLPAHEDQACATCRSRSVRARSWVWPVSTATARMSCVDVLTGMRRPTAGDVTVSGYPTTLVTAAHVRRAGRRRDPRRPASNRVGAGSDRRGEPDDAQLRGAALHAQRGVLALAEVRRALPRVGGRVRRPDAGHCRSACGSSPGGNQQKVVLARELTAANAADRLAADPRSRRRCDRVRLWPAARPSGSRWGDAAHLLRARGDPVSRRPDRRHGAGSVPARARFGRRHARAAGTVDGRPGRPMSERSERMSDRATARSPGGDGVRGRSPRGVMNRVSSRAAGDRRVVRLCCAGARRVLRDHRRHRRRSERGARPRCGTVRSAAEPGGRDAVGVDPARARRARLDRRLLGPPDQHRVRGPDPRRRRAPPGSP